MEPATGKLGNRTKKAVIAAADELSNAMHRTNVHLFIYLFISTI